MGYINMLEVNNMSFQVWEYFPGVFHIKDALGVCMTLMMGTDSALLFDTGYGLENPHDYIRSLTPLPLRVVLSHAHHDHALGSRFFDSVFLLEKERETFLEYTQEKWRRRVLREAGNAGILVDEEEYLAAQTAPVKILREGDLQLGGLTARVIACPGHTPGSAVLYVPELELLLTGDNWNPCTWLFFPEACGAHEYRRNVSRLLDLPFRYVLCPHNERVIPREELEAFLRQLTDEVLEHAPDDPAGKEMGIHTAKASLPGGGCFVFDREKLEKKYSDTWLRSLPVPVPASVRTPLETAQFELDSFHQQHPEAPEVVLSLEEAMGDGYEIIPPSQEADGSSITIRGGQTGILYGTYAFLLSRICKESLPMGLQTPACSLRMLDCWDNMDGSIERGYAGRSLWFEKDAFHYDEARIRQLGRMLSSTGINVLCINNVNVHAPAQSLMDDLLQDTARFARILRPFGIRLMLSADFSMPLGRGLNSADPLDDTVRAWWKKAADRIWEAIPDFAGFLIKADSEHRPGPHTYGRSHAEGANMIADAVRPHAGVVVWRAFVYNCMQDWRDQATDRPCAAYDLYQPLDGLFDENVILQVKYGPFDFQVREPISPLLLSMKQTALSCELQLAQEYTGHQIDLFAMPPVWREIFDRLEKGSLRAMAAVSNLGRDRSWTGHPFAALNLYAFGQFAWNPDTDPYAVIRRWIRLSYVFGEKDAAALAQILAQSSHIYEQYTAPLGLCWMVQPEGHYGPSPWGYEFQAWGTYNRADRDAAGIDRTRRGTGYAAQYPPALEAEYSDPASCPDELLLFFHRLPYLYKMRDGRTLIQRIYDDHFEGYEQVLNMQKTLSRLPLPQPDREEALTRMQLQCENAREWRDVINTFFFRLSGVKDQKDRKIY